MRKHSSLVAVACAIFLMAACQSATASGNGAQFRFGGLFGIATADHEDLNGTIEDLEHLWRGIVDHWDDEPVGGGAVVGGFAEYLVTEEFVLGAEFLRLSGDGGYDWNVLEADEFYSLYTAADVSYEATGNLVSIYGAYRLPIGDSGAALRFGAGIGYLFGAEFVLDFEGREVLEERRGHGARVDTTFLWQTDVECSGSGVAFNGLLGVEYQVTGQVLLLASASYRQASVHELTVDSASTSLNGEPYEQWWDLEVGEPLRWYDGDSGAYFSGTEGDEVGLNFGGVQFTVGLAYSF